MIPKDPPAADFIPLAHLIADVLRMMLGFLSNKKRKLMVGDALVLFVIISIARDGGRYTIGVIREIRAERSFIRSCLGF